MSTESNNPCTHGPNALCFKCMSSPIQWVNVDDIKYWYPQKQETPGSSKAEKAVDAAWERNR